MHLQQLIQITCTMKKIYCLKMKKHLDKEHCFSESYQFVSSNLHLFIMDSGSHSYKIKIANVLITAERNKHIRALNYMGNIVYWAGTRFYDFVSDDCNNKKHLSRCADLMHNPHWTCTSVTSEHWSIYIIFQIYKIHKGNSISALLI